MQQWLPFTWTPIEISSSEAQQKINSRLVLATCSAWSRCGPTTSSVSSKVRQGRGKPRCFLTPESLAEARGTIHVFPGWATGIVYTKIVRNITLSANEDLIDRARLRAAREKRTLNSAFREWLERYAGHAAGSTEYEQLMKRLRYVRSSRRYSRNEMNER